MILYPARVATQEPHPALPGVRDAAGDAAEAAARPHGWRSRAPGATARGRGDPRRGLGEQLASLYRRAACLVYPSLYEGFGFPPLEAMACGCPVAASNAGAIPEVCGDAAVLFDPTDVEAMGAALLEVDTRRDELTELGLKRAAQFTWDETARRHEDVYRRRLAKRPQVRSTTL